MSGFRTRGCGRPLCFGAYGSSTCFPVFLDRWVMRVGGGLVGGFLGRLGIAPLCDWTGVSTTFCSGGGPPHASFSASSSSSGVLASLIVGSGLRFRLTGLSGAAGPNVGVGLRILGGKRYSGDLISPTLSIRLAIICIILQLVVMASATPGS